jgi:hypothetical protein
VRRWILGLAIALGGCAWIPSYVPVMGRDPEPAAEAPADEAQTVEETPTFKGPCTRKGRRWPEGSRVCEDHMVTRCFADGEWRVIGSC